MIPAATIVAINGTQRSNTTTVGDFTMAFAVPAYPRDHWMNAGAFTAKVSADLYMGTSNYWPAVSVQAANVTTGSWDSVLKNRRAVHRPEHVGLPNHRSDQAAAIAGHHRDQSHGAGLGPG